MKDIPITQFMRPDGRQVPQSIPLADKTLSKYEEIVAAGCRLTAEVLMNGVCSFCVEHHEGDFDMELVPNGPQVPIKLTEMIMRFDRATFDKWLEEMKEVV